MMNERGVGYVADVLVFALLLSFASLLLVGVSPADPQTESSRYASSFAQSILLALQHSTADGFDGFGYRLDASELGLSTPLAGSTERNLNRKTLMQLLVEDALCNLRVESENIGLASLGVGQRMDSKLREFLGEALDKLLGGRFGYRLRVRTSPMELYPVRVYFESEFKNFNERAQRKLCSETTVASLPLSREELAQRIRTTLGITAQLESDPVVELTLELWST